MKFFLFWFFNISVLFSQVEIKVTNKRTAEKFGEKTLIEYKVVSNNEVFSSFEKEFDYDIPTPQVKIIKQRKLLLVNSFAVSLELLDLSGNVLKSIALSPKNVEYERSIFSAVNDENILAAVNETSEYSHQFFMLDSSLNVLSKSDIQTGLLSGIACDNASKSIFASVIFANGNEIRKVINVFDFDFKYKSSFAGSFNFSSLSNDNHKILLYDNSNYCLYDMLSNELLFQNEEKEYKILSAKFVDNSIALLKYKQAELVNSKWIYLNPEVYLLSADGNVKTKIEISSKQISKYGWNNNKLTLDNEVITLE